MLAELAVIKQHVPSNAIIDLKNKTHAVIITEMASVTQFYRKIVMVLVKTVDLLSNTADTRKLYLTLN